MHDGRPGLRYHIFFAIGGALAAAGLVFHVLAITQPWRGMQAMAVACVCTAAVDIAATLVYRRVDRIGQDIAALAPDRAWLTGLRRDLDVIGEPEVADLEPLLALRRIAERLHDADT